MIYRDFKKDTWEIFNERAQGKKIYIWGAGARGKEIAQNAKKLNSQWDIAAYIDSDPAIIECEGYIVIRPEQVKEDVKDALILISTDRPGVIARVLSEMGIEEYYSYYWMNTELKVICLQADIDRGKITKVKELLSDERSKEVLDRIVEKRQVGFLDYTDIWEGGDEYFDHSFFSYNDNEVFVDGGGYDGDTIEEFVAYTKNVYKRIYSFEPDVQTGEKLKQNLYRYGSKVHFYPYGLHEKRVRLSFANDNVVFASHIVGEGEGTSCIDCVSLDEIIGVDDVTFIKMDIEGAEIPALKGARKTIIRNKPKLAICIYHKPDDLWEIPELIHSFVPEYKFYIRHYGPRCRGTILFATI